MRNGVFYVSGDYKEIADNNRKRKAEMLGINKERSPREFISHGAYRKQQKQRQATKNLDKFWQIESRVSTTKRSFAKEKILLKENKLMRKAIIAYICKGI